MSAPTSRTVPAQSPPTPTTTEPTREYGLYAVIAGLVVLAALDAAALAVFHSNVNGAVGVIGALSSPIVAMISAYFGVKVGTQSGAASSKAAEAARSKAENEAKALLAQMAPEQARPLLRNLGIPTADSDP